MKKVAVIPFLAHGHMVPLTQLCVKLSALDGVSVTVISTPANVPTITSVLGAHENLLDVVAIPFPQVEGLPRGIESTRHAQNPRHLSLLWDALLMMREPIEETLQALTPDCLIMDLALSPLELQVSVPVLDFFVFGAASVGFLSNSDLGPSENADLPFPSEKVFQNYFRKISKSTDDPAQTERSEKFKSHIRNAFFSAILINSCNELEGNFIEYLEKRYRRPVIAVGPLLARATTRATEGDTNDQQIMSWVARHDPASVIYVAFGSEYQPADEEDMEDLRELGKGLAESGVPFVWAIGKVRKALLDAFESENGMIIEGWVPQRELLGHGSVGGFMSHCGWNSVMESVEAKLPMVAVPMQFEQGINARLISGVMKLGVEVERAEDGRVRREEVKRAVRKVMLEESAGFQRRASELGSVLSEKVICRNGSQDVNIARILDFMR
eukprot:TRINITY_DN2799_c0_g1_i2.p1 TRINITY_DN2799_c0_g1~~TRINITY_DN2799_c0_g1_i2.p1  ORF type:complete len:441 (+),score=12.87 TRINITY_DN2799_c0_g1_i2:159-1481(+)